MMRLQQRTYRSYRFFHLPNSITPMANAIQAIQSPNASQQRELFTLQQGHAPGEIFG
jgi:hypothetical protein